MPTPADGRFENKQTGSSVNFDSEDSESQGTISKDKQHDHSSFPQHSPIKENEEREEREDKDENDDEAADDSSENQNSTSPLVSLTFSNLCKIAGIPYTCFSIPGNIFYTNNCLLGFFQQVLSRTLLGVLPDRQLKHHLHS